MIKSVIAGAVAMAVVSFGVNAALTTPQGQGRVTFNGTVVDAPCSISQKSADQSIDFGQLSKSFLQAGGVNRPGFPGEYFICELRLPDHRFRWKHNKLFLLLPEEYGPAFPAIVDCYTSPPT